MTLHSTIKNRKSKIEIHFLLDDLLVEAPEGCRLQEVVDACGADISFGCRSGSCGTCRVRVASGLAYRDFMTVGLLLKKLKPHGNSGAAIRDNWIYIQEADVKIGRLQIFNNWSPYMVRDPSAVWVGMEYFCNEGDEMWSMADADFIKFAVAEMIKINLIDAGDVLDSTLLRMPKTYPSYTGEYENFAVVRGFVDQFKNLFLVGRNGMHRYNNQDHSMLTAMMAVDAIADGSEDDTALWKVNLEVVYGENGS